MTTEKTYRTFFAITVNADCEQAITAYQTQLQQLIHSKKINWIKSTNLHITLRYLGNTTQEQVAHLINAVNDAINLPAAFNVQINPATFFPDKDNSHVIILKITENQQLLQLHKIIDSIVVQENFVPTKRVFIPHLTIARLNTHIQHELLDTVAFAPLQLPVSQFVFFQSITWPEGVEYRPLYRFRLKKSAES